MLHLRTILHPTDLSPESRNAYELACSLARDHGARLIVLHIAAPLIPVGMMAQQNHSPRDLKRMRWQLRQQFPPTANIVTKYRVRDGDPVEAILAVARRYSADLVVMGTHGRTGLERFLTGSVAEKIVEQAPCPVFTLKMASEKAEVVST